MMKEIIALLRNDFSASLRELEMELKRFGYPNFKIEPFFIEDNTSRNIQAYIHYSLYNNPETHELLPIHLTSYLIPSVKENEYDSAEVTINYQLNRGFYLKDIYLHRCCFQESTKDTSVEVKFSGKNLPEFDELKKLLNDADNHRIKMNKDQHIRTFIYINNKIVRRIKKSKLKK